MDEGEAEASCCVVRNIRCLTVILLDLVNSIDGGGFFLNFPRKKTNSVLNDTKRHFVIAKILPIFSMKLMNQLGEM